jgi:hypothetical protein
MEDTKGDWMFLLKDIDDSMKEGVLHIISKVKGVRSQSNEPTAMKDSKIVVLFVVIFTFSKKRNFGMTSFAICD